MSNATSFVIRCGCDWSFPVPNLDEESFEACYADFRKHCIAVHRVDAENAKDCHMFLDLEKWTLTLLR